MTSKKKEIPPDKDSGEEEGSPAKRPRIEEHGEGSKRGIGTSSESDEEFTLGSDESGEEASSDSEGDSSDVEEEAEAEEGDITIVTGVQVELRKLESGNYNIFHKQDCKELKMLLPDKVSQSAITSAKEHQQQSLIPFFEATDVEITKADEIELIVYANELTLAKEEHLFSDERLQEKAAADEVALNENSWCVIKIENVVDLFATQDFQQ